jgi:hypothetical protein
MSRTTRLCCVSPFSAVLRGALCLSLIGSAQAQDWLKGIGDPTRPPPELRHAAGGGAASSASAPQGAASAPPPVALNLSLIRYDEASASGVAVINDQVVKTGEAIEGFTVKSISMDAVVLSGPSGVRRLSLFGEAGDTGIKPSRKHKHRRKEEQ